MTTKQWFAPTIMLLISSIAFESGAFESRARSAEAERNGAELNDELGETGWPFVRGPRFDGHSDELHIADNWPTEGPPVLWARELGQGYSAIVAHGKRVFTQAQSLGGQYVYCLNADSGDVIWEYRYAWPYEPVGVYPGPRSTPTFHDGRIYFAAPDGLVGCLDADNGRLIWSLNVLERYAAEDAGFGYSISPTIVNHHVILPVGGPGASLVALDASTGNPIWKSGSDAASYTPVFPIQHASRMLLVGYLQNSIVVVDPVDGQSLLRNELSAGYDEHSAWPVFHEGKLWISAPFRSGSRLLALPDEVIHRDDQEIPEMPIVWQSRLLSNDVTSSVLVDGHLYGFDIFDAQSKTHRPSRGMFRCIEFATGEEKWSVGTGRPIRGNYLESEQVDVEIGQAGIIVVDGKLIILNETGDLILARVNAEWYEELARVAVLRGELVWTPPTLHRGRVYIRNHSRVVCLYVGHPDRFDGNPQDVMTASDVPQSQYRDIAGMILAIEPEYAFDIPSRQWLWNWYVACIGIISCSGLIAIVSAWLFARLPWWPSRVAMYSSLTFFGGAIGTTLLSRISGDFFFTWPVCLFVAFLPVVQDVRWRRDPGRASADRLRTWLRLSIFLGTCFAYFYLCRRLSLVFEWAFLMGFGAAIPLVIVTSHWLRGETWRSRAARGLITILNFSLFYLAGVLVLNWRY